MARYLFDGGEQVVDSEGNARGGLAFTVWTERVGGDNVTSQMRAPDGVSTVTVRTEPDGEVPYLAGPDGVRGPLFRDTGTDTRSPWYSSEAMKELAALAPVVDQALLDIAAAEQRIADFIAANPSGQGAVSSVNGDTGAVTLTAEDVGARAASTKVPAGDVEGLKLVATTGKYGDLDGIPVASIPASDKGAASGVATLGNDGRLTSTQLPANAALLRIRQLPDGTWPLRNTVSSDLAATVDWYTYSATSPVPQAGNGFFGPNDTLYKKV